MKTVAKTSERFGAVGCAGSRHMHPPLVGSVDLARTHFNAMVRDAQLDPAVERVALFRYTASSTELVDEWVRPGCEPCNRHSEDRRAFDLDRKMVAA